MKRRIDLSSLLPLILICLATPSIGCSARIDPRQVAQAVSGPTTATEADAEAQVGASMAELPACFEQNVGQYSEEVAFFARGGGFGLFLTPEEMVLSLPRRVPEPEPEALEATRSKAARSKAELANEEEDRAVKPTALPPAVLRMRLVGATASQPVGEGELETKTNYFLGNDPAGWHTDVPNFASVRYESVYDGVDLVYYGKGGRMGYDFVVAPGADPSRIAMAWEGAEAMDVDENGSLVLKVEEPGSRATELRQSVPLVYQEAEAGKAEVAGRWEVGEGGRVGLSVGAYDASKALVIDPVLSYATFLGASGEDGANDIEVDGTGAAYVTGYTLSYTFPTTQGAFDVSKYLGKDVFVTKLNAAGNGLVYSTYIGGSEDDVAEGIDLHSTYYYPGVPVVTKAYIAGWTASPDFPTNYAYDTTLGLNGYGIGRDAFVTQLNATGTVLEHSTYLGGDLPFEEGHDIAVDSAGTAYVTGLLDGFAGERNALVTKLTMGYNAPSQIIYSKNFGGQWWDEGWCIEVDSGGYAYVAGYTESEDTFPIHNSLVPVHIAWGCPFVAKFTPDGSALVFSTTLAATAYWVKGLALDLALDNSGAIYLTGRVGLYDHPNSDSNGDMLPTLSAYDWIYNGGTDAFVAKLQYGPLPRVFGNHLYLVYCTYLGGSGDDSGESIGVDASGAAYVTGKTRPNPTGVVTPFPTNAYDVTHNGGNDVFVTKLSPTGNSLSYSTYLGGGGDDEGKGICVTSSGVAYVAGRASSGFPAVFGSYDYTYSMNGDVFVAKLE